MVKNGDINKFFSISVTLQFFNLNSFRFNFLPYRKKSNNVICGNYPAPLTLLSKHIKTTIKINIQATDFAFKTYTNHNQDQYPKKNTYGLFVLKRKGLSEKGALFYPSKPDSSSQYVCG